MTLFYGAAYHPEMLSPERWVYDANLMRQAGFNAVRIGEFAWGRMEPQPGEFTFTWLDAVIEVLNTRGIVVVIGTPTAGPPTWITNPRDEQPDCRILYEDGIRWEAGGRSHCCIQHPFFVERARLIADALGRHYADHPGVAAFQVDNEIGMFGTRCYCDACLTGFRAWLEQKYGTIDTLNERLGMLFGGNEFRDFQDIPLPRRRQDMHNPGLLIDSQRFYSDSTIAFVNTQTQALRQVGVQQPITTNVCHMFSGTDTTAIDNRALFAGLDVAGFDCYPSQFSADPPPAKLALLYAIMYGYKKQGFWMLEQQSGSPDGVQAESPRRSRLWTWQAIAHGAEMINYWLWRTHRYGAEQYFRGILDHDGAVNPRYQMVAQVGSELQRLLPYLKKRRRKHEVALLLDFDASLSLMLVPPTSSLGQQFYRDHAEAWFSAVQGAGHHADVIYTTEDLQQYRVVIAPVLRLVDAQMAEQLQAFVHSGGILVASLLTATLNRDHVALAERPPYFLQDLFGVERIEWGSLSAATKPPKELSGVDPAMWSATYGSKGVIPVQASAEGPLEGVYAARLWYDHLTVIDAQTLATLQGEDPIADIPALTVKSTGNGQAYYLASVLDHRLYVDLLHTLLGSPALPLQTADTTQKLEIVPYLSDDRQFYFVLNHANSACKVTLDQPFHELLSDTKLQDTLTLDGYGVALLTSL